MVERESEKNEESGNLLSDVMQDVICSLEWEAVAILTRQ